MAAARALRCPSPAGPGCGRGPGSGTGHARAVRRDRVRGAGGVARGVLTAPVGRRLAAAAIAVATAAAAAGAVEVVDADAEARRTGRHAAAATSSAAAVEAAGHAAVGSAVAAGAGAREGGDGEAVVGPRRAARAAGGVNVAVQLLTVAVTVATLALLAPLLLLLLLLRRNGEQRALLGLLALVLLVLVLRDAVHRAVVRARHGRRGRAADQTGVVRRGLGQELAVGVSTAAVTVAAAVSIGARGVVAAAVGSGAGVARDVSRAVGGGVGCTGNVREPAEVRIVVAAGASAHVAAVAAVDVVIAATAAARTLVVGVAAVPRRVGVHARLASGGALAGIVVVVVVLEGVVVLGSAIATSSSVVGTDSAIVVSVVAVERVFAAVVRVAASHDRLVVVAFVTTSASAAGRKRGVATVVVPAVAVVSTAAAAAAADGDDRRDRHRQWQRRRRVRQRLQLRHHGPVQLLVALQLGHVRLVLELGAQREELLLLQVPLALAREEPRGDGEAFEPLLQRGFLALQRRHLPRRRTRATAQRGRALRLGRAVRLFGEAAALRGLLAVRDPALQAVDARDKLRVLLLQRARAGLLRQGRVGALLDFAHAALRRVELRGAQLRNTRDVRLQRFDRGHDTALAAQLAHALFDFAPHVERVRRGAQQERVATHDVHGRVLRREDDESQR